eukprot:Skav231696  [mRNA]  locus=scaffold597:1231140:1239109:- [translate_table: standard]
MGAAWDLPPKDGSFTAGAIELLGAASDQMIVFPSCLQEVVDSNGATRRVQRGFREAALDESDDLERAYDFGPSSAGSSSFNPPSRQVPAAKEAAQDDAALRNGAGR